MNSINMVNLKSDKCDHYRHEKVPDGYYVINNHEQPMERQASMRRSECQKCSSHQDSEKNHCQNHDMASNHSPGPGEYNRNTQVESHVILQSTIEKQQQLIMQLMNVILNRMNEQKPACTCCNVMNATNLHRPMQMHTQAAHGVGATRQQYSNPLPAHKDENVLKTPIPESTPPILSPEPTTTRAPPAPKDDTSSAPESSITSISASRKSSSESIKMVFKRAPSPKPTNHKRGQKRRKSKKLNSARSTPVKKSSKGKRKKKYHRYFVSDCSEFSTTASSEDNWCPKKQSALDESSTDDSSDEENKKTPIKTRATRSGCEFGPATSPFVKRKASELASKKISTILSQDSEPTGSSTLSTKEQWCKRKGGLVPSKDVERSPNEKNLQKCKNGTSNIPQLPVPKTEAIDLSGANIFLPFVQQLWSDYEKMKSETNEDEPPHNTVFPCNDSTDVKQEGPGEANLGSKLPTN